MTRKSARTPLSQFGQRTLVRLPSGIVAVADRAPAAFTFCALCGAWQHPRWHEIAWRREMADREPALCRTYTRGPEAD